jgi:hypothetical protein
MNEAEGCRGRPAWYALRFLAALAACADPTLTPIVAGKMAPGHLGGQDAGVVVTDADIHVHVGCTFGNIAGNVALDSDGRFTVNGSYVLRAYPVQTGPSLPAQFSGRISGSTMTLAIAVNDTVENRVVALGPIVVVFDREPEMAQCPICRVPGLRP